jgi:aryl-alcohol dehydrogenase-like predicted oxidoreductase
MRYRQLGKTGITVSEIGFGAWAIGGPVDLFGIPVGWGVVDDRESITAIHRALDLGVNLFDTSDVYGHGHSEELLGQTLARKECVIATKVGNARKENAVVKDFSEIHIRKQLEKSLRNLFRETIDIYQLHNPPPEVWNSDEVFSLLQKFKQEGKILATGVSITTLEEGIHLIETKKVDVLQVLFNVLNQEPAKELLPLAEKQQVGIIARVPLASGMLTGKFKPNHEFAKDDNRRNYLTTRRLNEALEKVEEFREIVNDTGHTLEQVALSFLIHHQVVPIPGAKTPQQVDKNVSATEITLDERTIGKIRNKLASYNFYLRFKPHV